MEDRTFTGANRTAWRIGPDASVEKVQEAHTTNQDGEKQKGIELVQRHLRSWVILEL